MYYSDETSNTRFLVAKYIRDMHRLEPRNIGVVVWIDGKVSARFLGENPSGGGDIIAPRRLRVHNHDAYRQWVQHWREQMQCPNLSLDGNGLRVSRESPDFMDALRNTSKRQYVLVDGGFMTGKIDPREIDEVVHDLFNALVEDSPTNKECYAEEESVLLKKSISRALKDSGIESLKGYSAKLPLTFPVDSHTFSFTFDCGVYTNKPIALFQHAILTRPTTVNSAAFMFNSICRADLLSYRLDQKQCLALVRVSQQVMDLPNAQHELAKLKAYGTVIDLAQYDCAVDGLKSLASGYLANAG